MAFGSITIFSALSIFISISRKKSLVRGLILRIVHRDCILSMTFWAFEQAAIIFTLWLYLSMQLRNTCWLWSLIISISSSTIIFFLPGMVDGIWQNILTSVL